MDALPHVDDAPRPALSRADPAAESGPVTAKTATVERRSSAAPWITVPVLAAALAVIGVVAVHMSTAASIVSIWVRSETFAHGFVIVPICLWLIWRKREALAEVPAAPWWPGLLVVAGAGAMWFVTSVADVLGLKQFALAFMIQAAFVTVVGLSVARTLAFPLAFLLFAVPVGEMFVPTLIEWTADFTVAALRLSGVPVYREGNHFVIPSGAWSVVEACSGIRYIIASVMVGTIYAALAYRSPRRRALFVAAAIVTPIVANWLRAYIIVMLGHLSNNRIAAGVDHIIYGWVFFGVVMLLLFWIGSFWQEDAAPARAAQTDRTRGRGPRPPRAGRRRVVLLRGARVHRGRRDLGSAGSAHGLAGAGDRRPWRPYRWRRTVGRRRRTRSPRGSPTITASRGTCGRRIARAAATSASTLRTTGTRPRDGNS